jgi:hypothetical protein
MVCVCVYLCACVFMCALSLRAVVVLDLCPFGGRKFACTGGAGEVGVGRVLKWKGEERKDKVRNEELG